MNINETLNCVQCIGIEYPEMQIVPIWPMLLKVRMIRYSGGPCRKEEGFHVISNAVTIALKSENEGVV